MTLAARYLALVVGVVLAAGLAVATVALGREDTPVSAAADVRQFDPGNIISDAMFFDGGAMTAAQVDAFIAKKGVSCVVGTDGSPCLKNFRQTTTVRAADSFCRGYPPAPEETAGAIVAKVAASCGVSPRVLLVMMQKEQGLVTSSGGSRLYASKYQKTMGFACPDTAPCDAAYFGFQNQVYSAARQFKRYAADPMAFGYRAGRTNNILFNPNAACGAKSVYLRNQATAGLYIYTPYQPNAAALAAGYGEGDTCSAYGNRNFWLYFTDWFGSTQANVDPLPEGNVDGITSADGRYTVRGWAFDRTDVGRSIDAHIYVDGFYVAATTADQLRADIDAAFGVGPRHGFQTSVPASLGSHEVCIYLINHGGPVNPQLDCRTVVNVDAHAPVGALDAVTVTPGAVSVRGWAFDPDATSAQMQVHAYVDGVSTASLTTGQPRPDVASAHGVGPAQGFAASFPAPKGSHRVCVYVINIGPGSANPLLGCSTVVVPDPVPYNPRGSLDSVSGAGGTIRAAGWVYDPDVPQDPVTVHVYVDGVKVEALAASSPRPDVAAALPAAGGAHGFEWRYEPATAGSHVVCLYAINVGFGTTNPTLGCRTVTTVTPQRANPVGVFDAATVSPGRLAVHGWVYDPDNPRLPADVHVYVDGIIASALVADEPRADVGARYAGVGNLHGWSWSQAISPGRHQVCAFAINSGAGTTNPLLGCKSVTVVGDVARNPVGHVDAATMSGGRITVQGWAFDPDSTPAPAQVHAYVDGVYAGLASADMPRPDVPRAYAAAGPTTGFRMSFPAARGTRKVCVYAINTGPGTTNTTLGCVVVKG
ncbi:MAG: hypothetical protein JWR45_1375 [Blastococcus sp.]|nr:hypothetical protein [Blastococcus sp.]